VKPDNIGEQQKPLQVAQQTTMPASNLAIVTKSSITTVTAPRRRRRCSR